jgi:5'-nucleotidase
MLRKLALVLSLLLVVVLPTTAQDETFALTIMHTNDTHAAHRPNSNGDGGVARQATVVNQIRAEKANTLLLDAGDRFTGTLFHTTFLGQDQVAIMNALGYDAMTLGNHEFDNGDDVLAAFIDGLEFPVAVANVDFSASAFLADKTQPYVILDVNGQQVGVIGMVTADTVEIASPGEDLVWNADYVAVANTAAAELTEQGVNKIILLTHLGVSDELPLMEQLENIDVVLGGHSHTLYSNTYRAASDRYPLTFTSASGEPIYYAQAFANNLYLGRLDLVFDANGVITSASGDTILLSRYITPDPELQAIVDELGTEVEALVATETGAETTVFLEGDRSVCRVEECLLGNVIADAVRAAARTDIGIINGGGIRASLEAGPVTVGDLLAIHPFGNLNSIFSLTGADVIAMLENSVSRIELDDQGRVKRDGAAGRFLQVSGLRFTVDPTLDAGSRIVSVEVLNANGEYEPIDLEKVYTISGNNFIRTGGDGFTVLAEKAINPYDFGDVDWEVLRDYLVANSPFSAELEGRITYVNAEVAPR